MEQGEWRLRKGNLVGFYGGGIIFHSFFPLKVLVWGSL